MTQDIGLKIIVDGVPFTQDELFRQTDDKENVVVEVQVPNLTPMLIEIEKLTASEGYGELYIPIINLLGFNNFPELIEFINQKESWTEDYDDEGEIIILYSLLNKRYTQDDAHCYMKNKNKDKQCNQAQSRSSNRSCRIKNFNCSLQEKGVGDVGLNTLCAFVEEL